MAMILNQPHPATQPILSKTTFLFSVWQEKQEREREKRLKEMDFSTEAQETRGPGSPSKPVRRVLSY